jgi:hypothetical protein
MRRKWLRIALPASALVLVAAVLVVALAASPSVDAVRRAGASPGFDPSTAPPPWRHRCPITVTAYEDGSASLYCAGHRRRFATIDAETGRIRMRMPWAR